MNVNIKLLISSLELKQGASVDELNSLETEFQIKFPDDFREFLLESNGAEGFVGQSYLVIWSLDEMKEINKLSDISKYIPGLILIGSDGGDESYALDTRQSNLAFVEFPSIGVTLENVQICGFTFHEFLQHIFDQYSVT